MKKLLSILASAAVAGSSASAVVACGVPFTKQPNSDNSNSDSSSTNNTTDGDGWINNGKTNKPSDNSNNNSNKQQGVAKFNAQLSDVENTLTDQVKQQAPLDIWGFNGKTKNPVLDYLNHMKDKNGKPVLDNKTKATIESVLGYADGVSAPSPTALGSMISSVMPLLPTLAPTLVDKLGGKDKIADIEKTISGILTDQVKQYVDEFVKNGTTLDKFDKLTLNQAMESVAVGAAYILGILTGDRAGVQMFKDLTDPEQIISLKVGNKYQDETQIDRAIDYLSLTVEQIFFGQKNISLIAKGNIFDDKTPDKAKVVLQNDDIDVISDTIQLFSFYIGQFDQFRFKDNATNIDANNIFDTSIIPNGSSMSNYDIVNYVRTQKIGAIRKSNPDSLKFNPLRLISDISYYLGELDKPNGIYRVQALFSILFMDMDRTSAEKIMLNWDDSATAKKRVKGWTDEAGAEAKEENKTPLSRVIQHIMAAIMKNKTPDVFKDTSTFSLGWLIGQLGFSWDKISTWAVHNTYMIIQSIVWNKGFELSRTDTGFSVTSHPGSDGYGMDVLNNEHDIKIIVDILDYPGLASLSQWKSIQKDGLLRLLFNDSDANIYGLLNEISSNDGWVKMFDKINSMANGKADILGILKTKVLPMVVPFTNEDKGYNTSSAVVDLKDNMSKYDQVEFENAGKKTVVNSKIVTIDDDNSIEDNPSNHGDSGVWDYGSKASVAWTRYKKPRVYKVVADKPDKDGNTALYVSVDHMINSSLSDHYFYKHNGGSNKTTKIQGKNYNGNLAGKVFADTATVEDNGKQVNIIERDVLSNTVDGDYVAAKIKLIISGNVSENMQVHGWTFLNEGLHGAYWYGDEVQIGNMHVNMPWVKDDLGIYKAMGFDPANPTFDVRTLNFANGGLDKFKHLKVKGIDTKGNATNLLDNVRVSGLSINVKTVASHAVEWLLNVLGIDNNPMHLPFMDDNTMGSLILEIGKQIDKTDPNDDSEAQKDNAKLNKYLDSFGIDIKRFKYLIDVIFGAPGQDNVVTRLFNILTGDKANMASDLTKLLGAQGSNTYDKTGLIGALLYAFTPGLVGSDDDNPVIMGNTQKASPIWDKLLGDTGIIKSAWSLLNDYDISKLTTFNQVNADANYDSKFTKKDGDWNLTNAEGVITYTYKWEVRIKNDDGTFTYKWRTLTAKYNVSATRKNKDSKWSYSVEKAGEPVTADLD